MRSHFQSDASPSRQASAVPAGEELSRSWHLASSFDRNALEDAMKVLTGSLAALALALVIGCGGPTGVGSISPPTRTLSVTISGDGEVRSSPAAIDCNSSCSATFPVATSATLTAVPASGESFSGWDGACSGTGPCVVKLDADVSVAATFTQLAPPPPPPPAPPPPSPPANTHALTVTIAGQ